MVSFGIVEVCTEIAMKEGEKKNWLAILLYFSWKRTLLEGDLLFSFDL